MAEPAFEPSQESNSRRVLRGFVAMTASSFAVMGVQLGYAAITSRLLPPSAFGAYAVALSGFGLIGMLSGSSLGQSAARRDHDSVHLDRSLVTLALIVGSSTAMVAILLAPLWGRAWDVPESTEVTRVLALGFPSSALSAVFAGILRRGGRTSTVARLIGVGQLAGILLGLASILNIGAVWCLGVASVSGSVVTAGLLAIALPTERLKPARPTSASFEDAAYGAKAAGMNLLRFGTEQVPAWSIGRFVGAAELGAFNRATTLLTIPMGALQQSFTYSLFPEFRPGGPGVRKGGSLTDIMILISWPALFMASIGYFAAGPLITLLLGPGWETAGSIAGMALLLGVLQMIKTPLGAALEAQGFFKTVFVGWVLGAVATGLGATATAYTRSVIPAMLGLVIASLAAASVYLIGNARTGSLSIPTFARGTQCMLIFQALVTGFLSLTAHRLPDAGLPALAYVGVIGAIELGLFWAFRRRTAFWQIGVKHQLPGFTEVSDGPALPGAPPGS